MEEYLGRLAKFVAERPGLVVSVVALILIFSAISAQNVSMSTGTGSMFPKDNPIYLQYKMYERNFGVGAQSLFILIKGDRVISKEVYDYMLQLQNRIEQIEGVGATTSPASIIVAFNGFLPDSDVELEKLTETYASNLAPKQTLALIMIPLKTSDVDMQKSIAKQIEKIIESTSLPPGVALELTGSAALSVQLEREIMKSLGVTMTVSILSMVLILYITFSGAVRRKVTAFAPLIISVMSVQILYGLMPLMGIPLSEHTNGALPMLIGLAIEYGAQLQNRYEEERRKGNKPNEAAVIATTRTGLAIIMALLTTIVGFMSMLAPGIPAMSDFGIIASFGLILAYILTITFLPAALKLLDEKNLLENNNSAKAKNKKVKELGYLEKSLESIATFTAKRPLGILVGTTVIVILGLYASQFVELETNYNKYIPQDLPSIVRFKELERTVGGQAVYTLVLNIDELNSETLEKIKELSDYIVSREELVYDYNSLTKLVDDVAKNYDLKVSDRLINKVIEAAGEKQLAMYISGNQLAVHFYSDADTHSEYIKLYDSLKKDVRFYGFYDYYITGSPVLFGEMGRIMIDGQTKMTYVAYFLILVLLLCIYRSIRKAIVPLIAITSVIGVMNLIMFVFGVKQTMMSIALNSITLGLGIDFSIHILERYFEERRNLDPIASVRRTIERTGKAITTSALTMAGGFGSLMFSSFPILRDFGFIALVSILFSLIAALTVVPAFLIVTERVSNKNIFRINNSKS
ncbi:MAG: hydrophobe/amphiphile efflux-3 (HAE3) family transporter [Archaeoglobales archaeon]|nr:hydrophobe/amphiphile efflux-3 (HAE3) family transporter [Archaeoglobales archaeon]